MNYYLTNYELKGQNSLDPYGTHHHHHHQKAFRNKSHTSHGHGPGLKRNQSEGKRLTINYYLIMHACMTWTA